MNGTEFRKGQAVEHINRKLHEARFAGYTKSGRVRVIYNCLYPWGVSWKMVAFNRDKIESKKKTVFI